MASAPQGSATNILGCTAIAVATVNVFGGFAVSVSWFSLCRAQTFILRWQASLTIFSLAIVLTTVPHASHVQEGEGLDFPFKLDYDFGRTRLKT